VTKNDLIKHLTERSPQYSALTAALVVKEVLASIVEALARGERVEVRGFGSFALKHRPARERRNPRTGAVVFVPAMKLPFFKAAKAVRMQVNGQSRTLPQESTARTDKGRNFL
jgi:integration host factor subunit beta